MIDEKGHQPLVGIAIDCSPGIEGPCPHPGHRPPGDISHSRHAPLTKRRLVASLGSSPRAEAMDRPYPPRVCPNPLPDGAPFSLRDSFGLAVGPICCAGRSAPGRRVVVEERYLQIFKFDRIRPAVVAAGLAEMQVRWPRRADRVLRDPQKLARDVVVRHQYGRRIYETR